MTQQQLVCAGQYYFWALIKTFNKRHTKNFRGYSKTIKKELHL